MAGIKGYLFDTLNVLLPITLSIEISVGIVKMHPQSSSQFLRVLGFTTLTAMEVAYQTTCFLWGLDQHSLMVFLTVVIARICQSKKPTIWGRELSTMQLTEMPTVVGLLTVSISYT